MNWLIQNENTKVIQNQFENEKKTGLLKKIIY